MRILRCSLPAFILLRAFTLHAEIDPKNFDLAVKPQDDFYQYANGGWLKTHPIPPEFSSWGSAREVDEHNKVVLHEILERTAAASEARRPIEKLVGDF